LRGYRGHADKFSRADEKPIDDSRTPADHHPDGEGGNGARTREGKEQAPEHGRPSAALVGPPRPQTNAGRADALDLPNARRIRRPREGRPSTTPACHLFERPVVASGVCRCEGRLCRSRSGRPRTRSPGTLFLSARSRRPRLGDDPRGYSRGEGDRVRAGLRGRAAPLGTGDDRIRGDGSTPAKRAAGKAVMPAPDGVMCSWVGRGGEDHPDAGSVEGIERPPPPGGKRVCHLRPVREGQSGRVDCGGIRRARPWTGCSSIEI